MFALPTKLFQTPFPTSVAFLLFCLIFICSASGDPFFLILNNRRNSKLQEIISKNVLHNFLMSRVCLTLLKFCQSCNLQNQINQRGISAYFTLYISINGMVGKQSCHCIIFIDNWRKFEWNDWHGLHFPYCLCKLNK